MFLSKEEMGDFGTQPKQSASYSLLCQAIAL